MSDLSLELQDASKVVVMGIGSDLRGDDAAGVEVVRQLLGRLDSPKVRLIDAGIVPENFIFDIIEFEPSHVVLIDAADLNLQPGEVALVDPKSIVGRAISTHQLPLSILIEYLRENLGAKILVIGIQPASREVGAKMSKRVRRAVREVAAALFKKLNSL